MKAIKHPLDDGLIIVVQAPYNPQKLSGVNVVVFEKLAVASTSVHDII